MLTKLSIESARVLAEELERKNTNINVLPETPLKDLTDITEDVIEENVDKVDDEADVRDEYDTAMENFLLNTVIDDENTSMTHDAILNNITDKVAGLMNRRLDLARTVINPLISAYADMMTNSVASLVPEQPQVKEVEFGEFYDNDSVRRIFSGYGFNGDEPLNGLTGITGNDENSYYIEGLYTGNSIYDKKLRDILSERGDEWYKSTFNKYFTDGGEVNILNPGLNENYLEQADENLIAHALARYFYNRGETLSKLTTDEYDSRLLEILGRTSRNINGVFDYRQNLDNKEIVVANAATESRNIIAVYGPAYRLYKSKGGSDTALMGYRRSNSRVQYGVESLLENQQELEEIYDNEVDSQVMNIRNDRYNLLLDAARTNLIKVINEFPLDILERIPGVITDFSEPTEMELKELLLQRGNSYLSGLHAVNLDDVRAFARDVITLGLIPELSLNPLLVKMEKYLEGAVGVANLTPKEACYYAVLDELVEFFLSQTSLSARK